MPHRTRAPFTSTLRPVHDEAAGRKISRLSRTRRAPRVAVAIEDGAFVLRPERNFYSPEDAAGIFSVSTRTIGRWLDEGRLDAVRPGYRRLVTCDSIMRLLMEGWRRRFEGADALTSGRRD